MLQQVSQVRAVRGRVVHLITSRLHGQAAVVAVALVGRLVLVVLVVAVQGR